MDTFDHKAYYLGYNVSHKNINKIKRIINELMIINRLSDSVGQDILCNLMSGSANGSNYSWIGKGAKREFGTTL